MKLTPAEAAQRIGVHVDTLRWWRRENRGPVFTRTDGGHARYDEREVERYIEERKVSHA